MKLLLENWNKFIQEDRGEHIAGIINKIDRLRSEIERAEEAQEHYTSQAEMSPDIDLRNIVTDPKYVETQQRIQNMRDKIDLLSQQKQELEALEEATDWTRVKDLGAKPSSHPDKEEAVQKCWHETKRLDQDEFVAAFNACMEAALSPMAEEVYEADNTPELKDA